MRELDVEKKLVFLVKNTRLAETITSNPKNKTGVRTID